MQSLRLLSLLEFSRWLLEHLPAVSLESPEPTGQVTVLQEISCILFPSSKQAGRTLTTGLAKCGGLVSKCFQHVHIKSGVE